MSEEDKSSATDVSSVNVSNISLQDMPSTLAYTAPMAPVLELESNDGTTAKLKWRGINNSSVPGKKVEMSEKDSSVSALLHSAKGYEITWQHSDGEKTSEKTNCCEHVLAKLKPGALYSVHVLQTNKAGKSVASNMLCFNAAPLMPTDVQVKNYDASPSDSLIVMFKDENTRKMRYKVVLQPLTETEEVTLPDEYTDRQTVLVEGLTPGESYSVKITAVDKDGLHSKEAMYPYMAQTYPDRPLDTKIESFDEWIKFSWNPLSIRPSSYKVLCYENGKEKTYESRESSFTMSNLEPSTTYRLKVAGVNKAGCGDMSDEKSYTTGPPQPTNVHVKCNPTAPTSSLIVKYEGLDRPTTTYRVEAISLAGEKVATVVSDGRCVTLDKLTPGQAYRIYVVAMYAGKESKKAYYMKP